MTRIYRPAALAAVGMLFVCSHAAASCGSSFCSVNTQWESQGSWTEPGLRASLRFEYLDQDQLRSGTDKVEPAGVAGTHDELRTLNRNLLAGVDYTVDDHWSLSLQLPFVQRDHRHVHNDVVPEPEAWSLTGLGDVRALARYQWPLAGGTAGVQAGVKLPTGSFKESNADGAVAERMLQRGTGTTDALLGGYYHRPLQGDATTAFAQLLWQQPHEARDGYAPGAQINADLGLRYAVTLATSALLQLNAQVKYRDHGNDAEPDDSGGRYVFLSPGMSHGFGPRLQGYGFVQLPVYQYVNGTQLTADRAVVVGVSGRL